MAQWFVVRLCTNLVPQGPPEKYSRVQFFLCANFICKPGIPLGARVNFLREAREFAKFAEFDAQVLGELS